MNYIIFDLEFNQHYNFIEDNTTARNYKCPFEIIQIGAVKLDENLQTLSTFNNIVKPEIYTRIHPYVKQMTNITTENLNKGKAFKEVYKAFVEFAEFKSILCIWGLSDMKELFRNIEYHNLDSSLISKEYINIQREASKFFKLPKGTNIGLSNAVNLLNIQSNMEFHDAFNDAYYTSEVFKKIYISDLKPKIYNYVKKTNENRHNGKSGGIDEAKLIKQFEKMFSREMTTEEQSIIKLAYAMGKTNQFNIKPRK
ncbi:exonuclease domain-containing protein [Clostridium sp. MSJ-11]|uniref:Exonuclease domain-containing protein n=1 Tax=Clostridium mobile TaxID=2841512 RepID=A0ABS6EHT3_9CLOT|nr:3'-5' exonuclease [Clostridium mobile]MBU5484761.1 exonuclease domain-containing protein [Clostridium mobile]